MPFILISYFLIGGIITQYLYQSQKKDIRMKYWTYLLLVGIQCFLIKMEVYYMLAIAIVLIGIWEGISIGKNVFSKIIHTLVVGILGLFFVLFFMKIHSPWTFLVFVLVLCFDGFSQLSGQCFGKQKLIPQISPNKTIEGLLGGVVLTLATGVGMCFWEEIPWLQGVIVSVFVPLFSALGDLAASYFKRKSLAKDYSALIPSHGGILDRFDSLLVAAALSFLMIQYAFSSPEITIVLGYMALFLVVFFIGEMLYHVGKLKVEITRKFVHISSGLITLTFVYFVDSFWQIVVLCAAFVGLLLLSKRLGLLPSVNNIQRDSYGSIGFPIAVTLCFAAYYFLDLSKTHYLLPLLVLSISDALAALFGKRFPYGKYTIFGQHKTLLGSSVFMLSMMGIMTIMYLTHGESPLHHLGCILVLSFSTAVVEAFSYKGFDNLTIPIFILLFLSVENLHFI